MFKQAIPIGTLAVLATVAAPPTASAETVTLKPATQWNVDFGDTRCRLARIFSDGKDEHILFFDQYFPATDFGMTLAGPNLKRFKTTTEVALQFYAAQEERETTPFKGEAGPYSAAIIYGWAQIESSSEQSGSANSGAIPQLDTDQAAKVEFVSVAQGKRKVLFQTGSLKKAFEVLNACTQDMIRNWGLDVDQHLSATKRPVWSNRKTIVNRIGRDYPAAGLRRGEQAVMKMRIIIDETGSVEKCVIDKATDTEKLESRACAMMENAKFEPALDADGKPFRSYFATTITYRFRP